MTIEVSTCELINCTAGQTGGVIVNIQITPHSQHTAAHTCVKLSRLLNLALHLASQSAHYSLINQSNFLLQRTFVCWRNSLVESGGKTMKNSSLAVVFLYSFYLFSSLVSCDSNEVISDNNSKESEKKEVSLSPAEVLAKKGTLVSDDDFIQEPT